MIAGGFAQYAQSEAQVLEESFEPNKGSIRRARIPLTAAFPNWRRAA